MPMAVKIEITEVLKKIDKELDPKKATRIQNAAINKGAEKVASNLQGAFNKFKGTKQSKGFTADEVTTSKARKAAEGRRAEVGWSGPKERYRLIHLNEWGYTRHGKRYKPRMMGTVQQTLDKSDKEYFETVGKELADGYTKNK